MNMPALTNSAIQSARRKRDDIPDIVAGGGAQQCCRSQSLMLCTLRPPKYLLGEEERAVPKTYRIVELARVGEVPFEPIRYYEHEGLLPPPRRSSGNFRLYDDSHRERLTFIRQCRLL